MQALTLAQHNDLPCRARVMPNVSTVDMVNPYAHLPLTRFEECRLIMGDYYYEEHVWWLTPADILSLRAVMRWPRQYLYQSWRKIEQSLPKLVITENMISTSWSGVRIVERSKTKGKRASKALVHLFTREINDRFVTLHCPDLERRCAQALQAWPYCQFSFSEHDHLPKLSS